MLVAEFFWRVFPRDRPPQVFERVMQSPEALANCHRYPDALPLRKDRAISSSFPSRHSLTAGVFAAVMLLAWRRLGWWALAYGLLVAYGRVYGGKHWPTDVIVGFGVGMAFGALAWRIVPRLFGHAGRSDLVEVRPPEAEAPAG
jgi:membrane-associated phospholipid phosphatase